MTLLAVYCEGLHYRQELVRCGKSACKACARGPSHGPYWYSYSASAPMLKKRYVGKALPAAVVAHARPVIPGQCNTHARGYSRA